MAPLSLLLSLAALCSAADRKTTTVELPSLNAPAIQAQQAHLPTNLLLPQTALPLAAASGIVPALPTAAASAPTLKGTPSLRSGEISAASGLDKANAAAHHAASVKFDALAKERVEFSREQQNRLARLQEVLIAAAGDAAKIFDGMAGSKVVSRGSTSRGTQTDDSADFDINIRLPSKWTQQKVGRFVAKEGQSFAAALGRAVKARLDPGLGGLTADIEIGSPMQLNNPAGGKAFPGTFMVPVRAYNAARTLILDADFTVTIDDSVANDYPAFFTSQLEEIRAKSGDAGVERMLGDIRLAKRAFKEVLRSYTPWRGGPGGVGVEQMVLQAGGFEPMMRKLVEISADAEGQARPKIQAASMWVVRNPYMEPANFLELINASAWEKLVQAAKTYTGAQDSGKALRLEDLGRKPKPAPAPEETLPAAELRRRPVILLGVDTKLNLVRLRERLRALGHREVAVHSRPSPGNGLRSYSVSLELPRGADEASGREKLASVLASLGTVVELPQPTRLDPFAGFDAVVEVRSTNNGDPLKSEKAARRLPGVFQHLPGIKSSALIGGRRPGDPHLLGLVLEDPLQGSAVLKTLASTLKARRRFALTAASFLEKTPAAAPAVPVKALLLPGEATLVMLEKFTINGPKPSERGDAFLYAQGAKTLPPAMEEAGEKARAEKPLPEQRLDGGGWVRTTLLRRNGRVFVAVSDPNDEMGGVARIQIPENLVTGIPGDALIDVELSGREVRSARPVMGGTRAEVVIGRARRRGGVFMLEPLLFESGKPATLYGALTLQSESLTDGEIVQAFVSRAEGGDYQAAVMMSLGQELTPEIAVREIALRHGARGYFPAEVVAQTEQAAADQGEGALTLPKGFTDLRHLPFVTIDPIGAGDLDDAFHIQREADGGYTWILATADVARYVSPGTPAFLQAARLGNTFYSIDKDGVSDYPMNHPVVAKSLSSLLAGKDSYAMITTMRFDAAGKVVPEQSGVTLGLVRAEGRYTYDEAAAEWNGGPKLKHGALIAMARELAAKLRSSDEDRGELTLEFDETARVKDAEGWKARPVIKDPLIEESHKLIAALKVYGNRVIAGTLTAILVEDGVPHISRVHPKPERKRDEMARRDLANLGVPWPKNQTLAQYLALLMKRTDITHETKQLAQIAALRSRSSARYSVIDDAGHDGLALKSGEYDHPSAPIRRFSDMYNRALLETKLEGGDVRALYDAILADLRALGFSDLEDFVDHLNGREQGARQMDYEVERFMDAWELARPQNQGRPLRGYVKSVRVDSRSGVASVEIRLKEPPVSVTVTGRQYGKLKPLAEVSVLVEGAEPAKGLVRARITSP